MHAEIIAIGSELTSGAKLDTNSQWLSLALGERGIPTNFHTTVADDLPAMVGVLRDAVNRSDFVLITGGIGPTLDDLTRQAMAELVQRELVLDDASMKHVEGMFSRRGRKMPERNRIQAMFPEGSEPIFNPRGTAPGIWMEVPRKGHDNPCLMAVFPGVPSEMKRMFEAEVVPRLPGGETVIRRANVNCFGLGESHAEELLGELTARGRDPEVGITVHEATITLRITTHGTTAEDCEVKISAAKSEIRQRLGRYVFSEEDDELQHVVLEMLRQRTAALSTAESGTGGLLSFRLSEAGGQNCGFAGGLVAPNEVQLASLLDIDAYQHEFDDRRQRAEMITEATRTRFETDFALAALDCPDDRPDGSSGDASETFVALASSQRTRVERVILFGDPAIQKSRMVKAALNLLRLELIGSESGSPE